MDEAQQKADDYPQSEPRTTGDTIVLHERPPCRRVAHYRRWPTAHRSESGKHIPNDGQGVPLEALTIWANRYDSQAFVPLLEIRSGICSNEFIASGRSRAVLELRVTVDFGELWRVSFRSETRSRRILSIAPVSLRELSGSCQV